MDLTNDGINNDLLVSAPLYEIYDFVDNSTIVDQVLNETYRESGVLFGWYSDTLIQYTVLNSWIML